MAKGPSRAIWKFLTIGWRIAKSRLYLWSSFFFMVYKYNTDPDMMFSYIFAWIAITMIIIMLPFNMWSPPGEQIKVRNRFDH